ncbi:PIR Superfamily Protein [Plasmodium ovale wallikeri]|uniref:PIR Superfamily Protein n=1 Tax=Plasmodium ovale wallikeri TaxID=864142 RepID=A0A1A9AI08_PLAOA|nr:PIR Superfamily Protein [Plasmodium ovale wallikeri]
MKGSSILLVLKILGENDLQANVFDEKWKKTTKFSEFEDIVNLKQKLNKMEDWIFKFDAQLFNIYSLNSIDGFINIQDKRCRDLNYYINYMLHHIPKITNHKENSAEIKEKFQNFLTGIFSSWKHDTSSKKFKCTRVEKDYTPKMELIKKLDDFCENKNAFKAKLETYDKITCCKYANHVNNRKSFFHNVISSVPSYKNDLDFHINEKCTLNKFGATFPNVTCNEDKMVEIESDALNITNPHGQLTELQDNQLSGINPEDSFNNSPTKIAFTSVSTILGACISGLYLYRHSFIGNMLRNSRNKNIIPLENEYADINGKFSEDPLQYIDNPEDISRFYVGYNSMNN